MHSIASALLLDNNKTMSEASASTDDGSDDSSNWQIMHSKRKKKPKNSKVNKKQKHTDDLPSTSKAANSNKFSELSNDDEENENNEENKIPKPPPIFVPGVADICNMVKKISGEITEREFNYKAVSDGQIKLNIKTIESYRKLVKYFEKNNICYHTFQLKTERAYRIVIKNLHHSTPVENIKAYLLLKGHQVRYVANIKHKQTKQPLPIFYVDLDPSPNNKEVYDIKSIDNAIVKIEPPLKTSDIVQCHRCQEYGHTKTYCKRPYACVKCGFNHPTTNCQKRREDPPSCALCSDKHTANYKGCQVYQNLLRRRLPTNRPQAYPQFSGNMNEFPNINHRNGNYIDNNVNNNVNLNQNMQSYAASLKYNASDNNVMKNIETLLNKQIELTTTLMNMMSLLINKLCN